MSFRRKTSPEFLPEGDDLTTAMVGIGMNFAARGSRNPSIEDTLVAASREGMEKDDLRVLSILTTWIEVHSARINADRLVRALAGQGSQRVRAYWAAVGVWLRKDLRFKRLIRMYDGDRIDLLRVGNGFQVQRRGEDSRFSRTALCVPSGVLRNRLSDVLTPKDLAQRHSTIRYRTLMGPSYRADMWAALEREPTLSAAELARKTYGSFATAWQVKRDFGLLAG